MTSLLSTSSFHCRVEGSNSKVGLDFSARTPAAFKLFLEGYLKARGQDPSLTWPNIIPRSGIQAHEF